MIEDFQTRLNEIQVKMDRLVNNKLAIERDINRGELIEDFYQERCQALSEIKSEMFWVAMEMQHLLSGMREFNDKFAEAKRDPQVSEMWETIETAMRMVK